MVSQHERLPGFGPIRLSNLSTHGLLSRTETGRTKVAHFDDAQPSAEGFAMEFKIDYLRGAARQALTDMCLAITAWQSNASSRNRKWGPVPARDLRRPIPTMPPNTATAPTPAKDLGRNDVPSPNLGSHTGVTCHACSVGQRWRLHSVSPQQELSGGAQCLGRWREARRNSDAGQWPRGTSL
jgi:hypothetical protein